MDKLMAVIRRAHEDRCGRCAGYVGAGCDVAIREQAGELYRSVVEEYEGTLT